MSKNNDEGFDASHCSTARDEGYREQWVLDILAGRSVLQVALDVHMTTTGSYVRDSKCQHLDLVALRQVLATWKNPDISNFDEAVFNLLVEAIKESQDGSRY